MWSRVFALLALGGCAQIFDLDATSRIMPDARVDPPSKDAPSPLPCTGGDTRSVDPATGACYMLYMTPMTWAQAQSVCHALGPTTFLASVQSASENALIATLIGSKDAFLGGTDAAVEGRFLWDDGTPVQLTNWNTGEPNNAGGVENCIEMIAALGGKWNDVPCAPSATTMLGTLPFVCERD
jgi:hypothetical protein